MEFREFENRLTGRRIMLQCAAANTFIIMESPLSLYELNNAGWFLTLPLEFEPGLKAASLGFPAHSFPIAL